MVSDVLFNCLSYEGDSYVSDIGWAVELMGVNGYI